MSTTRTDAEELELAIAAVDRAINRPAKLVASDDPPTRDHATFQLKRLGRIPLRSVITQRRSRGRSIVVCGFSRRWRRLVSRTPRSL